MQRYKNIDEARRLVKALISKIAVIEVLALIVTPMALFLVARLLHVAGFSAGLLCMASGAMLVAGISYCFGTGRVDHTPMPNAAVIRWINETAPVHPGLSTSVLQLWRDQVEFITWGQLPKAPGTAESREAHARETLRKLAAQLAAEGVGP